MEKVEIHFKPYRGPKEPITEMNICAFRFYPEFIEVVQGYTFNDWEGNPCRVAHQEMLPYNTRVSKTFIEYEVGGEQNRYFTIDFFCGGRPIGFFMDMADADKIYKEIQKWTKKWRHQK